MTTPTSPPPHTGVRGVWAGRLAGLAVAVGAALVGWLVNRWVPLLSPLLVALLLGIVAGNATRLPEVLRPGLTFAAKPLLRAGIVLLGLQISFGSILGLGLPLVGVIVAVTACTFLLTTWLARRLGLPSELGLLVAAGCSICGAAAIAGMNGAVGADEDDVASAIGIITLFGLVAIPVIPLAATALGLPAEMAGAWAGASIHEVAQVVAAAGTIGAAALATAVVVKLTRVLLLAPMVAAVSAVRRRSSTGPRPPLVPLFVVGFLVAVAVRSLVPLPAGLLGGAGIAQNLLLATAMFALGAGVRLRHLVTTGGRTVLLGAAASTFIAAAGLGGVLLAG
ncbi:YeiH family protein [Mariniluteicoccus flavus]